MIAYGAGGALETVVPGVTGEFFGTQTAECLAETVSRFDESQYDSAGDQEARRELRHRGIQGKIRLYSVRRESEYDKRLAKI